VKAITILYVLNATLLLLHEIESGFEREWEILGLPGKLAGFLILHVPVILALFYGLLEIERRTHAGSVLGIVVGIGGIMPLLVHKILVNKKGHFNSPLSNLIIYLNALTGIGMIVLLLA
jgi:hypothetical protein